MQTILITIGLIFFIAIIIGWAFIITELLNKSSATTEAVKSKTGYSCPECETHSSEESIVSYKEAVFTENSVRFPETHKCPKCGLIYEIGFEF